MALHFGGDAPYAKDPRAMTGVALVLTSHDGLVLFDGKFLENDFGNGVRHETDESQTDPSTVSISGM